MSDISKEKIVMALRGETLVYLADGLEESMDKVKSCFEKFLKVPIVYTDVPEGIDIKQLKDDPVLLNNTFRHLIERREPVDENST